MQDLLGAFYCIGVMDGRTHQLGECTKSLLEFKETLDALILENDRLKAENERLKVENERLDAQVNRLRDRLRDQIQDRLRDRLRDQIRGARAGGY